MSFDFRRKLPVPKEVKEEFPVSPELAAQKAAVDALVRRVFTGDSDKFVLVIGPCSADHEAPVLDYCTRLSRVQLKVSDRLILIPRVYTNKPRSTGAGYKGMLHQPDPEKGPDVFEGVLAMRRLHMRVMEECGLPTADEMLYPENYWYVADLLSYVAVGARSAEDQQHRLTASGIEVPAGMKNPTGGDLQGLLHSVSAAQHGHTFIFRGWEVRTDGNPLAHAVLRGYTDRSGAMHPNYSYDELVRLADLYQQEGLKNPACVVDCNHANSGKQFKEQIRIARDVLGSRRRDPAVRSLVKGLMIESYLEEGCQGIHDHVYGRSITDPCLGWEDTERLIYEIAELV